MRNHLPDHGYMTNHNRHHFALLLSIAVIISYADYIVEDPDATSNNGPPYFPFPIFAPITISKAGVRYTHNWLSIAAVPDTWILWPLRNS
jgi:hypothetical protein